MANSFHLAILLYFSPPQLRWAWGQDKSGPPANAPRREIPTSPPSRDLLTSLVTGDVLSVSPMGLVARGLWGEKRENP